ncbi:nickel ABC transporter substrate-binding protein [uncultured Helicobacter sp.]|uniref:nickel ABC transporter substrate-binding protein n=1 Tax=uncultured Helicobacter sp. TaxID=175537 RepID=UPI00374E6CE7
MPFYKTLYCLFLCCFILNAQNTLRVAISQNVGALNPQGYNTNAMFAQNMLYEGLVRLDKNGVLIPSLATSWEVSSDGKVYGFVLREGVRFSNGEVFNADAVVLNFESILKNRVRHSWCGLIHALDSVKKIDDFHIELHLKYPYAPTIYELSLIRPFRFLAPSAFPKDLDLVKHDPKPIGTGAYMLIDSKLGVSDSFAKNPYYWDKAHYNGIYFDTIFMRVIFDPNTKLSALKSGQIDLIYGYDTIPIEMFQQVAHDKRLKTYLSPPIFTTSLVLNSTKIPLNIREAIARAINKQELVSGVYGDMQSCTDWLFITRDTLPEFDTTAIAQSKQTSQTIQNLAPTPCQVPDLPRAKALLAQTNPVLQTPLTLELLYSGDSPAQKMLAQILAYELKSLGIELKLSASEPTIYRNRQLKGNFELSFNDTWGVPYEPLSILYSMLTPSHIDFSAQAGVANIQEIHHLITKLLRQNPHSRNAQAMLREILHLLSQSYVYIPLTAQRNKAIASSDIKGIQMGVLSYEIPFWELYK